MEPISNRDILHSSLELQPLLYDSSSPLALHGMTVSDARMQAASMPCEGSCDAACGLWVSHVTYWRSVRQGGKRYPAAVRNGLEKTSATKQH